MPTDVLIYAIVAAGLVIWLRNILGTRHGEERERPNPYAVEQEKGNSESMVPSLFLVKPKTADIENRLAMFNSAPGNRFQIAGRRAMDGIINISRADKNFEIEEFFEGAQEAFVMIVEAFAKGDLDTLKSLLEDKVFQAFEKEISARKDRGETVETEIHAIRRMEITEASLNDRTASITIKFTASETCVIRDSEKEILSGNPERITEMIDVWVFTRNVRSKSPIWFLNETRDDVVEDHKTPLPEAGGTE